MICHKMVKSALNGKGGSNMLDQLARLSQCEKMQVLRVEDSD